MTKMPDDVVVLAEMTCEHDGCSEPATHMRQANPDLYHSSEEFLCQPHMDADINRTRYVYKHEDDKIVPAPDPSLNATFSLEPGDAVLEQDLSMEEVAAWLFSHADDDAARLARDLNADGGKR